MLAEHTAITRSTEGSDWVSLMISKEAFNGNLKIESTVTIGRKGHGIGFLFCATETVDARGYCLWIASEHEAVKTTKLTLSSVSVLEAPEILLKCGRSYHIRIEKIDDRVLFYLNDALQFSYASHIPVTGTHIGILSRDADFEINSLEVFVGSQNIMVNCLAVPDAFLADKLYDKALNEYRRLGQTFPGRAEGREALFRAGMTLLEQAKDAISDTERAALFDRALEEFGNLRSTPGAPLEYLGKSFVYLALAEHEEEAKCFELALRRYKNNPLLSILEEQIVFRMHETSRQHRLAAYHFIGLVTRFLKVWAERPSAVKLFASLQKNWEIPFFILHSKDTQDAELKRLSICLGVGFWLAKPHIIAESVDEILQRPIVAIKHLSDALFLLVELGAYSIAQEMLLRIRGILSENEQKRFETSLTLVDLMIACKNDLSLGLQWLQNHSFQALNQEEERFVWFLLRQAIDRQDASADQIATQVLVKNTSGVHRELIDALLCEHFLYQGDIAKVGAILQMHSPERLSQESNPLYFLYACFLVCNEGIQSAFAFFSKLLDIAFPRSWVLGAHFLSGKIHMTPAGWLSRSFLWERRALYQQLALFWHCAKDMEKSQYWKALVKQEHFYE